MEENTTDKAIIEILRSMYEIVPHEVEYDEQGNLFILDISNIMSWFIVRTHHRYTHHLHWRDGAVLTYSNHLARIEAFPRRNELSIEVWGVEPRTFLVILKDTIDLILSRFEGLQIKQEVPCICHYLIGALQQPCPEVYDYEKQLIKRLNQGIETIQCNESFQNVNVRDLLYGLHVSTILQVQDTIAYNKAE